MSGVTLHLPYPPSANKLWRCVKGRAIKSAVYRTWLELAAWQVKNQKPEKLSGPVHLRIQVERPDKRHRDIDNLLKPVLDALKDIAFEDDSKVQSIHIRWLDAKPGPELEIYVSGDQRRFMGEAA